MYKYLILSFIVFKILITQMGCSTASVRVLPGEDGVNRIVSRDIEKEGAEEAAVDAANDYCKDRGKSAIFLDEKTQYTGSMDENTRRNVRMGGKAAQAVGMTMGGLKGNRNSDRSKEISDLEWERKKYEMELNTFDQTRKNNAQNKINQIDAEIARLKSEKERTGAVEDVAVAGGTAAQVYTSTKDYQNEIRFKCQ